MSEEHIGPFELIAPLGHGGRAHVWRARHRQQKVEVALKLITSPLQTAAQFKREVRATAQLNHPAIIRILDYGTVEHSPEQKPWSKGAPWFAMQIALGGSLEALPHARDWDHLVSILNDLLDALAHAHARGVIHRDIKPANVLLIRDTPNATGPLVLSDFGLASLWLSPETGEETSRATGTPHYMAPEQIRGRTREQGPWTDLYALGCLAYRMTWGRAPFASENEVASDVFEAHLTRSPKLNRPSPFDTPPRFTGWLRKMLSKDPVQRFQRAADASAALRALGRPPEPPEAAFFPRNDTLGRRRSGVIPGPDITRVEPVKLPDSSSGSAAPFPLEWRVPEVQDSSPRIRSLGLGLVGLKVLPVTGREAEQDLLWSRLAEVHTERSARVTILSGDAGTGKTRLANWLLERGHEVGGLTPLITRASPQDHPHAILARMVSRELRCDGLDRKDLANRLRQRLTRLAGYQVSEPDIAGFVELLGRGTEPGRGFRQEDRPGARFKTPHERYLLIVRLIAWLTRQRPVCIHIDNGHIAPDALDFVRFLIQRQEEHPLPVMVLITTRAESNRASNVMSEICRDPRSHRIHLSPLTPDAHRRLIKRLIDATPETVATIAERTDGNPLFAVQLIRSLASRQAFTATPAGFLLEPGSDRSIPDDIHQLWRERIREIVKAVRAEFDEPHEVGGFARRQPTPSLGSVGPRDDVALSLEVASALGPRVELNEWQNACARLSVVTPPSLVDHMAKAGLAEVEESGWSFCHGMLRESVARVARERGNWRAQNRACAKMLLDLYGASGQTSARLAFHWLEAESWSRALEPLLEAAEHARISGDFDEGLRFLDLHRKACAALNLRAGDDRHSARLYMEARIYLEMARLEDAIRIVDKLELLTRTLGRQALLAKALWVKGGIAHRQGNLSESEGHYLEAGAIFEELEDDEWQARCLHGTANTRLWRGQLESALESYDEAMYRYRRAGTAEDSGYCLVGLGVVHRRMGDPETAQQCGETALATFEQAGSRYGLAVALNDLGETARSVGNLEEAEAHYRRAMTLMEDSGSGDATIMMSNLALVLLERQEIAAARPLVAECIQRFASDGQHVYLAHIHAMMLICVAAESDWLGWDKHVEAVRACLDAMPVADDDLASIAQLAAERAEAAGGHGAALAAWKLASSQWSELGRDHEAEICSAAIARLES